LARRQSISPELSEQSHAFIGPAHVSYPFIHLTPLRASPTRQEWRIPAFIRSRLETTGKKSGRVLPSHFIDPTHTHSLLRGLYPRPRSPICNRIKAMTAHTGRGAHLCELFYRNTLRPWTCALIPPLR
jgi:hypothetical protein